MMKVTYSKEELTTSKVARDTLIKVIADSKHGGFMRIHGFKSKTGFGEIQDTTYCKGINYANSVRNSLALLTLIEKDTDLSITVTRGVWKDTNGNINPTNRKSKVFSVSATVTETYDVDSEEMIEALAKVRKGLENPRPTKDYKSLGNGIYVDEETDTLYVRDLRLVRKTVVVHGDYPFKASGAVTALRKAIERDMPIGSYRQFCLDAEYDKISLGGMELSTEQSIVGKSTQEKEQAEKKAETVKA